MRFAAAGEDQPEGTTVITQHVDDGGSPGIAVPRVAVEDFDQFVRTDKGWRIASRSFEFLYVTPSD